MIEPLLQTLRKFAKKRYAFEKKNLDKEMKNKLF